MTRDELLALAQKVAMATGPDRELDGAIARSRGWTFEKMKGDARPYFRKPGATAYYMRSDAPTFTASIDAALTLVPAGCWAEGALGRHDCTRSALEIHAPMTYDPLGHAEAATPALALTAAALRAQAAMMEGRDGR